MPAERHQVNAERLYIRREIGGCLNGIRVEQNIVMAANFRDSGNWINGTDLVVGVHHRDKRRFLAQSLLHRLGVTLPYSSTASQSTWKP